jgi:sarcosine oxidase subunit alpha
VSLCVKKQPVNGAGPAGLAAALWAGRGAHFLAKGKSVSPDHDEGYMTSTAFSPSAGCWIGLGLLARGPERIGERIRAYDPIRSDDVEVEVVPPVFVDPEAGRLRA